MAARALDGARRLRQRGLPDGRLAARPQCDRQGHPRRQHALPHRHRRDLPRRRRGGLDPPGLVDPRPRGTRPGDDDPSPPRSLRPPDGALAAVLLAAEGGLDHRAPDERRRRGLGRALAGDADARLEPRAPPRRDSRALHRRLAARARRARRPTADAHPHALVHARLARRARREAQPHRRRHGADRRVGLRHGGRAGVQPRARVPGAVRRAERGEPRAVDLRAEDLLDLLPVDRVSRRDRHRRRALLRREAAREPHADDRDADHGALSAPARVPAAAGALRRVRAAPVGRGSDGEDRRHPRRGAGDPRAAARA